MSPPLHYRLARQFARAATGLYFFNVQASGQEKIPEQGPLIFAANHPNSLMDPVIMGIHTKHQIRYMARSGHFEHFFGRKIMEFFDVIPVYRRDENTNIKGDNQSSFREAYKAFEQGQSIGLFPEGKNSPDRRVRDIKTGTARIALGAEAHHDYSLGLKIQPVGLNYDDRERYLSNVLIRFGDPIVVNEYAALHQEDPRAAVLALTERIQNEMRQVATHIEDERNRQLILDIYNIYGHELAREFIGDYGLDHRPLTYKIIERARLASGPRPELVPGPRPELEDRFALEKHIKRAVEYYQKHEPGTVARVRMDIRRYKDHLEQVRLRHEMIRDGIKTSSRLREAFFMTLYAIALGPVAIYGLINNAIPYAITRYVISIQPDRAMITFATFFTGLLSFPVFYFLQSWALWSMTDKSWVAVLIYLISLPITGFFHLRWWRQLLAYRDRILSRTLFRTRYNLIRNVERERDDLLETFQILKDRYIEAGGLEDLEASPYPDGPSNKRPLSVGVRQEAVQHS